jgi:hypothetical protein
VNGLLRWEETRAPAHAGLAGEVWLFTYTWDDSKDHPGEPWVMTSVLPGFGGRTWRGADGGALRKVADEVLAGWLKRIGVPS